MRLKSRLRRLLSREKKGLQVNLAWMCLGLVASPILTALFWLFLSMPNTVLAGALLSVSLIAGISITWLLFSIDTCNALRGFIQQDHKGVDVIKMVFDGEEFSESYAEEDKE